MKKVNAAKGLSTTDVKEGSANDPDKAMDDMEAQGHYHTLMSAHEIMNNPDKLKKVRAIAGRKALAASSLNDMVAEKPEKTPKVNSIADLKQLAKTSRMKKMGMS